jgi:ABC-type multidrug transport system ATPase subunit
MSVPVCQTTSLTKCFSKERVLSSVSFEISHGEVFFLLGPNGSGKTTLINNLLGLLRPSSGEVKLFGSADLDQGKKKVGVILEQDGFFNDLSAVKNLRVVCLIKGVGYECIPGLFEKVGLVGHEKKKVKKFSQGMRKRLAIAASMVGDPDFLIWDEPYNALDPDGFRFLRNLIEELNANGKTLLISTHLLEEASRSATRVALLYKSQLKTTLDKIGILDKHKSMEDFYFTYTT